VNPAVHVSAPRALWPSQRTVIEEAWRTFFTECAGRAVKCSQQPVCADLGPWGVQSCQYQAIPVVGGVTTRRSSVSSLMSLLVRLFSFDQEERLFRVFIFSRYVLSGLTASLAASVLWDFRPLCVIRAQGSPFEVFCLLFKTFE
jgi:hypothetical protein